MRKFTLFLLAVLMMTMCIGAAFASEPGSGVAGEPSGSGTTATQPNQGTGQTTTPTRDPSNPYNVPDPAEAAGIPNVTTDDLIERIDRKGNDVVNLMQAAGKWICIVVFIVCIILFIIGLIGNKKMALAAFIGMICAGVAYAGILCGREIVTWIASWAAS